MKGMRSIPSVAAIVFVCVVTLVIVGTSLPLYAGDSPGDGILRLLEKVYVTEIIPAGASVAASYSNGDGEPVGRVEFVRNDAYISHKGASNVVYKAKKGLPIFQGDTLMSGKKSSMIVLMNDKSRLTLSAYSRLVINKSVYNEQKKERETFLDMLWGKVRCVVTKLQSKDEDFKVNTPLATIGVRGSDFVIARVDEADLAEAQSASWMDWLGPKQAHAVGNGVIVVSGVNTTLNTVPHDGSALPMSSFNAAGFLPGRPAITPRPVTPNLVNNVFQSTLPSSTVMSMPELLE